MTNEINLNTYSGKIFFSVVRIEARNKKETVHGTGFMVSEEKKENEITHSIPFLVTNKHVIEGAEEVSLFFIKSKENKPLFGETVEYKIKNPESWFFEHPSKDIDLAILLTAPLFHELKTKTGDLPFFIPIPNTPIIATEEDLSKFNTIEEIIFTGYPEKVYDKFNLTPINRKGITATPIGLDYNKEPIFLVDSMIFHGSSGSPVFIYDPHGWTNIDGSISLGSRLVLVGIMSGFLKDEEEIEMKEGRVGIATLLNLGEVIKSYKIKELIKIFREKNKI